MAPYKVVLIPPEGGRLDLVIPVNGGLSVLLFAHVALQRAAKDRPLPSRVNAEDLRITLGSPDGLVVDLGEILDNVITPADVIFMDATNLSAAEPLFDSDIESLQIRILTPHAAQYRHETQETVLLRNGHQYELSTTLEEIEADVCQHLGISDQISKEGVTMECNCKLAEILVKRGTWDTKLCIKHTPAGCEFSGMTMDQCCAQCSLSILCHKRDEKTCEPCHEYVLRRTDLPCGHTVHSHCLSSGGAEFECPPECYTKDPYQLQGQQQSAIVVYGHSQVEKIEVSSRTRSDLMRAVEDRFGLTFTDGKTIICKGGLEDKALYMRLPVVAICAVERHHNNPEETKSTGNQSGTRLDLHTLEGPINTQNLGLTLKHSKLDKLAIQGVLTLFAVERRYTHGGRRTDGQDSMFSAGPHWEIPQGPQTERGMAATLASLRVFTHIISSEDFKRIDKHEVLRVVHNLTHFPPAVRAVHILMDGKRLQNNESAALVQSLAVVAEMMVPFHPDVIYRARSLESARLVLGLILVIAGKQVQIRQGFERQTTIRTTLPYVSAFRTIDLRDIKTGEPVTDPVSTKLGFVNRGVFEAFSSSGLLGNSPACHVLEGSIEDIEHTRFALLYGGVSLEASYYEAEDLILALADDGRPAISHPPLYNFEHLILNMQSLALGCERIGFVVVHPEQLSLAKAPCLTLDRRGNLAVYTRRTTSAAPGQHHVIFHPLTGVEENVDIHIMAQLLQPILRGRRRHATHLFDHPSRAFIRKDMTPTELLMFCVDCSYSMNNLPKFTVVEGDDASEHADDKVDLILDTEDDSTVELEYVKEFLREHEAYDDILHIIHHSSEHQSKAAAREVIDFLRAHTDRHLTSFAESLRKTGDWASTAYPAPASIAQEKMNTLRKILEGLNIHQEALADFLIFSATDPSFQPSDFRWSLGQEVPRNETVGIQEYVDMTDFCTVPENYMCPISSAVFEDPVMTSDGFLYDRKAIERWFAIRRSSPMTGLPLTDTSVTPDEELRKQIQAWLKAKEVGQESQNTSRLSRLIPLHRTSVVDFVGPNIRFTREIPRTARLLDVYEVAYRGMRVIYNNFTLFVRGTFLPCNEEEAHRFISGRQTVTISPNHAPGTTVFRDGGDEMCLIKLHSGNPPREAFSYWIPLHSRLTIVSVLFRAWRCQVQFQERFGRTVDRSVWTEIEQVGDGFVHGSRHSSWDPLSPLLFNLPPPHARVDGANNNNNGRAASSTDALPHPKGYKPDRVLNLFLFDHVDSHTREKRRRERRQALSSLALTKQIFGSFVDRLVAHDFPTEVGLVTFGSRAKMSQPLTLLIERFRRAVDRMEGRGDTALWDAVALAADHLVEQARRCGHGGDGIKMRIVVLSDGKDTSSRLRFEDVVLRLGRSGIVLDCVCVGPEDNSELRTLSYMTGGLKYVPASAEEALAICEMTRVLSLNERDEGGARRPPVLDASAPSLMAATANARPDPVIRG
ncbi:hypothetical protein RBB50_003595 [Rhinocladiella similis]